MKVTIETRVIKTILNDSSASALSVLVALKETLSKIKKITDEVPTLKQVAKAYGLQERTIKKFLPYLINKGFLKAELIPSEWVSEVKGKITKEVQKVINIVTEATQKQFTSKQDRIFQQKKNDYNSNRNYGYKR